MRDVRYTVGAIPTLVTICDYRLHVLSVTQNLVETCYYLADRLATEKQNSYCLLLNCCIGEDIIRRKYHVKEIIFM